MTSKEKILAVAARYEELELWQNKLLDAIHYVQEAEQSCPSGFAFSHHAEMEISDCLCEVEEAMQKIADKMESL